MLSVVLCLIYVVFAQAKPCTTPDQETGTCISIRNCKSMLDFLEKAPEPIPSDMQTYLRSYGCGYDKKNPKICCPSNPIVYFPDVSKHKNVKLLPKNCGYYDSDNKITFGEKTGLSEFPWMALLSYRTKRGSPFKCGGTIINKKYILTAAHCISNLKSPLAGVRVGEHNLKTEKDCQLSVCNPPFQDLVVEEVIVHPKYNRNSFTNDIGLLRVAPINLSLENSQAICLPLDQTRTQNLTNKPVQVTGWGLTEKRVPSDELLKVTLNVVSLEQCEETYRKLSVKLDERQICTIGNNGKDSCNGDSGGPLQILSSVNGETRYIQHGIVSFGHLECGRRPIPGVFTRVAAFMDWILDNINP